MKTSLSTILLAAVVFLFSACESELNAPQEVSVNTKGALELLPSDAIFVGMINPDLMSVNSHLKIMQDEAFSFRNVSKEMDGSVRDFLDATGFDPVEDVKELYVAFSENEEAALAVYADIRADKFEQYADEQLGHELTKEDYNGISVYSDGNFYIAFANDELLVAASSESGIQKMIDRVSSDSPSLSDDLQIADLIGSIGTKSAWFIAKDLSKMKPGDQHESEDDYADVLAGTLQSAAFGVDAEAGGMRVKAILGPDATTSPSDVASMARGAIAGMRSSAKTDELVMSMLDGIQVKERGQDVTIDAFVSNEFMVQQQH